MPPPRRVRAQYCGHLGESLTTCSEVADQLQTCISGSGSGITVRPALRPSRHLLLYLQLRPGRLVRTSSGRRGAQEARQRHPATGSLCVIMKRWSWRALMVPNHARPFHRHTRTGRETHHGVRAKASWRRFTCGEHVPAQVNVWAGAGAKARRQSWKQRKQRMHESLRQP